VIGAHNRAKNEVARERLAVKHDVWCCQGLTLENEDTLLDNGHEIIPSPK
jgi:hypothetical protein